MAGNVCPQCGAPIDPGASECKFCGEKLAAQQAAQQFQQSQPQTVYVQQPQPQVIIQQAAQPQPQVYMTGINPSWPVKNKIVAGIPAMIAFVEGIIYLCSNDENFQLKHHVRLG